MSKVQVSKHIMLPLRMHILNKEKFLQGAENISSTEELFTNNMQPHNHEKA